MFKKGTGYHTFQFFVPYILPYKSRNLKHKKQVPSEESTYTRPKNSKLQMLLLPNTTNLNIN